MGSTSFDNTVFSPSPITQNPGFGIQTSTPLSHKLSAPQTLPQDSNTLLFPFYEDNFLLEAIDKIIKKRWRIIGRTTRYGWLAACSYNRTVSPEDARILSALGNKIGVENSSEAIERIKILSEKLHPRDVPTTAIAVLTETHTALMLRERRGSKSNTKLLKDRFPTIFTISDPCIVKRTDFS